MAASIAIIAMTTNSSIKVKAASGRPCFRVDKSYPSRPAAALGAPGRCNGYRGQDAPHSGRNTGSRPVRRSVCPGDEKKKPSEERRTGRRARDGDDRRIKRSVRRRRDFACRRMQERVRKGRRRRRKGGAARKIGSVARRKRGVALLYRAPTPAAGIPRFRGRSAATATFTAIMLATHTAVSSDRTGRFSCGLCGCQRQHPPYQNGKENAKKRAEFEQRKRTKHFRGNPAIAYQR